MSDAIKLRYSLVRVLEKQDFITSYFIVSNLHWGGLGLGLGLGLECSHCSGLVNITDTSSF